MDVVIVGTKHWFLLYLELRILLGKGNAIFCVQNFVDWYSETSNKNVRGNRRAYLFCFSFSGEIGQQWPI